MVLKRIYLDQRDWIALARQHYGLTHDDVIADVLALVLEASATGRASFPLSATHYMETYHQRDPGRRQRLGAFMAEVSRFHTIASAPDLLEDEVHVAVCALAGVAPSRTPEPFGRGVRHALGQSGASYFTNAEVERQAVARFGTARVFEYFETAALVGPDQQLPADGIALPTREFSQRQLDFELETAAKLRQWGHNSDRAHRAVLVQEAHDIIDPVNKVSAAISFDAREALASKESMTSFMLSLPAKGMVCRLRMSGHEDQSFRWHIGDLNDISSLGTAAAYCDVVVAEKHWGSILRRHSEHTRAVVTSNLSDLLQLLLS
ncbi:hypothetical protein [Streptomyces sp. 4F14]|uniref:hypothetical protein n=1 Tax=Streptomyces sp. 4F14 TaxID=3394380 RepID=UPI003A866E70